MTNMQARIKAKRTNGLLPPAELEFGELAFSDGNNKLYVGKANGTVASFRGGLNDNDIEVITPTLLGGFSASTDNLSVTLIKPYKLAVINCDLMRASPISAATNIFSVAGFEPATRISLMAKAFDLSSGYLDSMLILYIMNGYLKVEDLEVSGLTTISYLNLSLTYAYA